MPRTRNLPPSVNNRSALHCATTALYESSSHIFQLCCWFAPMQQPPMTTLGCAIARGRCWIAVLLLVFLLTQQRVEALSAALYVSANGNSNCNGAAYVSSANLDSGACFAVGGYGARITCTSDGRVSQAALYESRSCDIIFISGSGVGDGVSCITLGSPRTSVRMSTIVDCSAPGSASSKGASAGVIAGAVVGSLVGVALLVGAGWWCYRSRKNASSMSGVEPSSAVAVPMHHANNVKYATEQGFPPGAVMSNA